MLFGTDLPLPVQLGVAIPPTAALFFVGKWLISRIDTSEADKKALYERVIADVVPALSKSTDALLKVTEALDRLRESEYRWRGRDE